MKKYIIEYVTNYGTQVMVINAENEQDAKDFADMAGAWYTDNITNITDMTMGLQYISST